MAKLLALPFHITPAGVAATTEQGSDDYYKHQMTTILMTMEGERPINTELGMPDMAFDRFAAAIFQSKISQFLPDVSNIEVVSEDASDTTENVTITFDIDLEQ